MGHSQDEKDSLNLSSASDPIVSSHRTPEPELAVSIIIKQGYHIKQVTAFNETTLPDGEQITKDDYDRKKKVAVLTPMRTFQKLRTQANYVAKSAKHDLPPLQFEIEALASALGNLYGEPESVAKIRLVKWNNEWALFTKLVPNHRVVQASDCTAGQTKFYMHLAVQFLLEDPDFNPGNLLLDKNANSNSCVRIDLGEALEGFINPMLHHKIDRNTICLFTGKLVRKANVFPTVAQDLAHFPNTIYMQPPKVLYYSKEVFSDIPDSGIATLRQMSERNDFNKTTHLYFLKALLLDKKTLAPTLHAFMSTQENEEKLGDYLENRTANLKRALMQVQKFRANVCDDKIYADYTATIIKGFEKHNQPYLDKLKKIAELEITDGLSEAERQHLAAKKVRYLARLIDIEGNIKPKLVILRKEIRLCHSIENLMMSDVKIPEDLSADYSDALRTVLRALNLQALNVQNPFHIYALQMAVIEGNKLTEDRLFELVREQFNIKLEYLKEHDEPGYHKFISDQLRFIAKENEAKPKSSQAASLFYLNRSFDQCLRWQDEAREHAQSQHTQTHYDLIDGFMAALSTNQKYLTDKLDEARLEKAIDTFALKDCGYKNKNEHVVALNASFEMMNLHNRSGKFTFYKKKKKVSAKEFWFLKGNGNDIQACTSALYEAFAEPKAVAKARLLQAKGNWILSKFQANHRPFTSLALSRDIISNQMPMHLVMQYLLEDTSFYQRDLLVTDNPENSVRVGLSKCLHDYTANARTRKTFRITPINLCEFPSYVIDKPKSILDSSPTDLYSIRDDATHKKTAHKYFLKALLFDKDRILPIAHAFINEKNEVSNLQSHLAKRMQALRRSIVQVPEFRMHVCDDETYQKYANEIVVEFQAYNLQFEKNIDYKSRVKQTQRRARIIDIEKVSTDLNKLRKTIQLCHYVSQLDTPNPPPAGDLQESFDAAKLCFTTALGVDFNPQSPFHHYAMQMVLTEGEHLTPQAVHDFVKEQLDIIDDHLHDEPVDTLANLLRRISFNFPTKSLLQQAEILFYINGIKEQSLIRRKNYSYSDYHGESEKKYKPTWEKLTRGMIQALPTEYHGLLNQSLEDFAEFESMWFICGQLLLGTKPTQLVAKVTGGSLPADESKTEAVYQTLFVRATGLSTVISSPMYAHQDARSLQRLNFLLLRCVHYSKKIKDGSVVASGKMDLALPFLNKVNTLYDLMQSGILEKNSIQDIADRLVNELKTCMDPALKLKDHHGIWGLFQQLANLIVTIFTLGYVQDYVSFSTHRKELLKEVLETSQMILKLDYMPKQQAGA